ncbi:MAG: LPS export ABC transporter periplasmic protein LptC, partial [Chlorobiaceae bacterium]
MKRVIVLFLHAVLIMASGCGDPVKERRSPETGFIGTNHSVQESWGVRLALTESGNQRGIIDAGHGEEYRTSAGSEHHLDHGIRLTLFDANGQSKTIITAQKALIHENQDIEAQGNVIITSGTTIIKTEYIKRTAKDQMIRSNRFVTITKPEETIRGEGFESDQALKKYRIFRGSGEA